MIKDTLIEKWERVGLMTSVAIHQHPRKIPFNPDNNRGWEIWTKTNENNCS